MSIHSDRPIIYPEEDILGRFNFSEKIGEA
jgi:hypothetical protein